VFDADEVVLSHHLLLLLLLNANVVEIYAECTFISIWLPSAHIRPCSFSKLYTVGTPGCSSTHSDFC